MRNIIYPILITVVLPACQSPAAKIFEHAQPMKLTSENMYDIRESMIWDLTESHFINSTDSIQLGKIAAARYPSGIASLCGYFRVRQPEGTLSDEKLFVGIYSDFPSRLRNDRVSVVAVSNGAEGAAHMRTRCREIGVEL